MPNWTQNIICIDQSVSQERFEAVMLKMLKSSLESELTTFTSAAEAKHACEANQVAFDFNALIPMPKELNVESGTDADMGRFLYAATLKLPDMLEKRILDAVTFQDIFTEGTWKDCRREYEDIVKLISSRTEISPTTEKALEKLKELAKETVIMEENSYWGHPFLPEMNCFEGLKEYPVNHLLDQIRRALNMRTHKAIGPMVLMKYTETTEGKKLLNLGKQCYTNIQKYGYKDWYDWCYAKWGTKWNASETCVDWEARKIKFTTAWSEPTPIMSAFHEAFPDVDFTWRYADEDRGYGTGLVSVINGSFIVDILVDGSSQALTNYVACWGADDCMYQDDTGEWHRYDCDKCPNPCC